MAGKCLMQQGLFQFAQCDEFAFVDGGEALGFFAEVVQFINDTILRLQVDGEGQSNFSDFFQMKIGNTYTFQSLVELNLGRWRIDEMEKETGTHHWQRPQQSQAHVDVKGGVAINDCCHASSSILCEQDVVSAGCNSLVHFKVLLRVDILDAIPIDYPTGDVAG